MKNFTNEEWSKTSAELLEMLQITTTVRMACDTQESVGFSSAIDPAALPQALRLMAGLIDMWAADMRSAANALDGGMEVTPMN